MNSNIILPDYLTIPLQLVRDREIDATDRMLYGVIYWYEHMKDGRCFASNETMAKILGTTARVIQNSLARLESRGYIRREYKDTAKRNRLEIKSLVAFKYVSSTDDTQKTSVPQMIDVSSMDDRASDPQMTRVILGSNNSNKNIAATSAADEKKQKYNHLGAEVIHAFEEFNPSVKKYYTNTTQRSACDRLIETHGLEKVLKVVALLPKSNGMRYAPTITTPLQLEEKWSSLGIFFTRLKSEKQKRKVIV